jgi:Uri superfamily endonuclease
MKEPPLEGFGSSDCTCTTHLFISGSVTHIRNQCSTVIQELSASSN